MALNFPHKSDVRLENPPLEEVICQVRFSPILRIGKEEPSDFQEVIRSQFPQIELEQGFLVRVPGPGSGGTPAAEAQSRIYRFLTSDGKTVVSLASDFYAVSTTQYTHWEDFAQYLNIATEAVQQVYAPAYATRIGLRYVNRLTEQNTGCHSLTELFDLLHPELTRHTRVEAWDDPVEMRMHLSLSDGLARLNMRTGHGADSNEHQFFLLDFDYFEEGQLPLDGMVERCDQYHDKIYRAFRWCIQDERLDVFKPRAEELSK